MPAWVARFELEVGKGLLADLNLLREHLVVPVAVTPAAFVEGKFGIDQLAPVGGQPLDPVESPVGLLAAGKRKLDRAPGMITAFGEADQGIDPDRRHRLVVGGTARVEKAVFLEQGEGIAGPVLALGLDHIDMGDQQDRPQGPGSARPDGHQSAFAGMIGSGIERELVVGESRRLEPRGHPLGGQCATAQRKGGVGFDQFLEEAAKFRLIGPQRLGLRADRTRHERSGKCGNGECPHRISPRLAFGG
jgi:hypothetical protein